MNLAARLVSRFKSEFAGQLVSMGSGALLMVLLARMLRPGEYGLLSLSVAVFGVVGVFSKLGIAKSCARYVAEYKEQKPDQIPHVLQAAIGLNVAAILVTGTALLLAHRRLAGLIGEPDLVPLLSVGVLFLAFESLKLYAQLTLQGFEEIQLAATVNAVDSVCRLVLAVTFVALGYGAVGALVGYVLGFAVAAVLGIGLVFRRFYFDADESGPPEDGLRRRIGEYAVPLTATNTANTLDKRVDTILVGVFLTPVAVTYYTISKQVIQLVETPVSALGFTLSPTFGAQKAADNVDRAARIYEEAMTHSLLLYVPAAAGIVLVAAPMIELVFGAQYRGAVPVLQVLAPYAVLRSVTKITSNGLDFLGRARDRAIVKGVTALLNVGLNVVMIPAFGVVGAAVATLGTYSLYTLANVYIIHSEFDLRVGFLVRSIARILVVTAAMAGTVAVVAGRADGFVSLAAVVALGVAIWGALSIATGLLDVRRIVSMV